MESIIQQIVMNLVKKIMEKAIFGGIRDIDNLASESLQECKQAILAIIEAIVSEMNKQIREDKAGRKERGLVLKEKDRARQVVTELGTLNLQRDYYYDKTEEKYCAVLDDIIGIRAYERVGDCLSAKMVSFATEVSYAKSAAIACGGKVSRQTVKNCIQKLGALEILCEGKEPKAVKELHVYADEDHVHMQKPCKEKGKESRIVPLVTVTEGTESVGARRNKTKGTMHFVDENFNSKNLWKSVEGYIGAAYKSDELEKIYIHADGGKWISNGLETFAQTEHVMDGYHLEKYIKKIAQRFPNKNISQRIRVALVNDDENRAKDVLQSLYEYAENEDDYECIEDYEKYILGNWKSIVNRKTLNVPGSCTEGQVSHVLAERFSRDPLGWSDKGLGVLSKLRIYMKNGGEITAKDFKTKQDKNMLYSEYADRILTENIRGAFDWSVFERDMFVMDGSSATQRLIQDYGRLHNTFIN